MKFFSEEIIGMYSCLQRKQFVGQIVNIYGKNLSFLIYDVHLCRKVRFHQVEKNIV